METTAETNGANGTATAAPAPDPTPPAPKPPVIVDKKLVMVVVNMSVADRYFPAKMLNETPWGGGESVVLCMGRVYETLKLEEIDLNKPPTMQSKKADSYILSASDCEFMLNLICGAGGKAIGGPGIGPLLARLTLRVRTMVNEAVDTERTKLENEAAKDETAPPEAPAQ